MIKKLTFAFFVLTLCFKVNSQTKLFNDDGTYRTDGIYYVNIQNFDGVKSEENKTSLIPIIFYNKFNKDYFTDYTFDSNKERVKKTFEVWLKTTSASGDWSNRTYSPTEFWENVETLKSDMTYQITNSIPTNDRYEISFPVPGIKYLDSKYLMHHVYINRSAKIFRFYRIDSEFLEYKLIENNYPSLGRTLASNRTQLKFLEIYEMSDDYKQKQIAEAKRIQEEKDRINAIAQQKANAEAAKTEKINNDKRIAKIKTATVGDRLCYSESWTYTERSSGFFGIGAYDNSSNYKVIVVAYIEKIVNGKYQVRVGSIESTDKNHYQTPTYKGVKLREESIHWINPITDKNWYYCE